MAGDFTPVMSATDSVMWAIERDPDLRSTVTAVGLLDRPPDRAALRSRVEAAVEALPRLRQRVVEPLFGIGQPRWVDDPFIDLDYHLRTVSAVPWNDRWLLDFASTLAEAGFDRDRPLWEFVVVEGLQGGGAALVQKVHHSLTDGVGAVELMASILDWSRHPRRSHGLGPHEATQAPSRGARNPAVNLARNVSKGVPAVLRAAADPIGTTRKVWLVGESATRLLAPSGIRKSPVMTGHSTNWHFDVHEESLDSLRRAAHAAGGTVNAVFVAAVAGGLHRYHLKHGREVEALQLNLPVSRRQAGDPLGGNRFTPVRFSLPIAELDPVARVRQVGVECRKASHEPALPLTDAIASVLSVLPPAATTAVMGSLLRGTDAVATNIPGIDRRCYIAGAELLREFAFAPLSGAAINVALMSHAGEACVGVNMDRAAVSDPEVLMTCLGESFAEIVALGEPAPVEPAALEPVAVASAPVEPTT